jgi:hypothetical protein
MPAIIGRYIRDAMPAIVSSMRIDRHGGVHVQVPQEEFRPFNTGAGSIGYRSVPPGFDVMGQPLTDRARALMFRGG